MGAFSGMRDAKRGFTSNPLRAGRVVARIDECAFFDTENKGEMWKSTLTILAVDQGEEHRVGEQVHVFFKMAAGKKVFQQNVKSFIAGVLDVADEEVGEEEIDAILAADGGDLRGLVTVVTSRMQTSKKTVDSKTGEPVQYVVHSWAPSLTAEEIVSAIGEEAVERFFPNGL